MQYAYTIVYVPDVQKAVEFYEKAFGLTRRFVHESLTYAEMETGGTALAFASNEQAATSLPNGFRQNDPSQPPVGIELAFTTDNVKVAYDKAIKGGAKKVLAPETKPWGQDVSYVLDLNGILVEICSPI